MLESNTTLEFYVDDCLIHVAGKLVQHEHYDGLIYNNWLLRDLFGKIVTRLGRLGLGVKVDKLELMHFRRARDAAWNEWEPLGPKLKLQVDGQSHTVEPKHVMQYLGFYLDPRLSFREHVQFYATKASSTRRLYISNVLPILTYSAQLWWDPGWKGKQKPTQDGITPITHIDQLGRTCTEEFAVLEAECRPGDHVKDVFDSQVTFHMNVVDSMQASVKVDGDKLDWWVRNVFVPMVMSVEGNPACALVFMDSSQKKGEHIPGGVAAGAAWVVKHWEKVRWGQFGCRKATPYNAEMAALAQSLNEVMRDLPESVSDIHVFAYNRTALTSILAAGTGPAQMLSVVACQSVHPWLACSPEHWIHVWWCPGHRGMYWNTVIDKDASLEAAELSGEISFAYARQCITANAYAAWRKDMQRPAYRGHNSLVQNADFERCKHTSANWFLRTAEHCPTYLARLVQFTSGHFPYGAFCEHFNFDENQRCWYGTADVKTRDHIWFDCDLWIKKHKPPDDEIAWWGQGERNALRALDLLSPTPPGMSSLKHFLQDWRETPIDLDDVAEFLRLNPAVETFTWLELVDQALADREQGEEDSLALLKADLHIVQRKKAYEMWVATHPSVDLASFTESYAIEVAEAVAKLFEIDELTLVALQAEFGLPAAKARARQARWRGDPIGTPAISHVRMFHLLCPSSFPLSFFPLPCLAQSV
ncbi:uncharacterized protein PHACADRAFT_193970 [Phanerochaete carnosa HHB-10118-sp]|uniref:RNase H type-1 domain-containing protein n=1 Tax=Phanerochaete carnosa (strain HHB-10118-sp) TaxID=650164 RepID=K5VXR6_PHACS|nr:uncharacterized protein PHACADRAFT_193970 [Phanerochaete carnosa HHB-10118-sp]EKM56353.1 hypothetical protein PHACADRAFT_193970 [Phanerochaete carnosa HHB-10118-sp]